jgi:hypothetical protein
MKFLTPTECDSWLADRRREKPNSANANFAERLRFPNGGWGGFLLSHMDYLNAFFSHDEYLDLFSSEESVIMDWRQAPGIDKGF